MARVRSKKKEPSVRDILDEFPQVCQRLKDHCEAYDEGKSYRYRDIAVVTGILIDSLEWLSRNPDYDRPILMWTTGSFYEHCESIESSPLVYFNADIQRSGLNDIIYEVGLCPLLDIKGSTLIPLKQWLKQPIIKSDKESYLNRRKIVEHVRNKRTGAHARLEADHRDYVECEPLIFESVKNNIEIILGHDHGKIMINPTPAMVRQIGHEILQTLYRSFRLSPESIAINPKLLPTYDYDSIPLDDQALLLENVSMGILLNFSTQISREINMSELSNTLANYKDNLMKFGPETGIPNSTRSALD